MRSQESLVPVHPSGSDFRSNRNEFWASTVGSEGERKEAGNWLQGTHLVLSGQSMIHQSGSRGLSSVESSEGALTFTDGNRANGSCSSHSSGLEGSGQLVGLLQLSAGQHRRSGDEFARSGPKWVPFQQTAIGLDRVSRPSRRISGFSNVHSLRRHSQGSVVSRKKGAQNEHDIGAVTLSTETDVVMFSPLFSQLTGSINFPRQTLLLELQLPRQRFR
ncbi:hypothetical protein V8F06_008072 [Rhypophila decipiens]